jgi:hypothetical protein
MTVSNQRQRRTADASQCFGSPKKAMIQQTLRHKSNDHFWFTFFHEARHSNTLRQCGLEQGWITITLLSGVQSIAS